jgi:hypothetical protein
MYLIKNISKSQEFNNITEYTIDEQPNLVAKKQFVNGKRKKIVTSYTDIVIEFSLKGLNGSEAKTYLDNLIDEDVYQFWSVRNNTYEYARFIVNIDELPLQSCLSDDSSLVDEFTIKLEKCDDYEVSV